MGLSDFSENALNRIGNTNLYANFGLSVQHHPHNPSHTNFGSEYWTEKTEVKMACECAARQRLALLVRQSSLHREVPGFLVPCVIRQSQHRPFSSTPKSQSRIGRSEISIPPDVSLRFFDLPNLNTRTRKIDTPKSAVEIKGPLGMPSKANWHGGS